LEWGFRVPHRIVRLKVLRRGGMPGCKAVHRAPGTLYAHTQNIRRSQPASPTSPDDGVDDGVVALKNP
jgi:hypothetical protein